MTISITSIVPSYFWNDLHAYMYIVL